MQADHGWQGGGRFKVARRQGALIMRFEGLSTRAGKLKSDIGDFFRKDYRHWRAGFDVYSVRIWVEEDGTRKRIDPDNVAKACLDALTGVLWADDSQVARLLVEKIPSEREAVTLLAEPLQDLTAQDAAASLATLMEIIERNS